MLFEEIIVHSENLTKQRRQAVNKMHIFFNVPAGGTCDSYSLVSER
jgi:hypothetical protein